MNKDRVLGAVRHILTTLGGGWFVSRGIVEDAVMWEAVASALVTLMGFVWSWAAPEKKHGAPLGRGGLGCIAALFLALPLLAGCAALSAKKPEIITTVDAACAFVPAAVSLAGGSVDGAAAEGLALACAAARAGARSISATVYDDPARQAACAGPVSGNAAYLALRREIGC